MVNVLIYVATIILTYGFGILSKRFKWNEQMPIPVQSIFIWLIVLTLSWFLSEPINAEETFYLIIASAGGAGTATLGYDTKKAIKKTTEGE